MLKLCNFNQFIQAVLQFHLATVVTANIYLLFACIRSVENFVPYRSSELMGVFAFALGCCNVPSNLFGK